MDNFQFTHPSSIVHRALLSDETLGSSQDAIRENDSLPPPEEVVFESSNEVPELPVELQNDLLRRIHDKLSKGKRKREDHACGVRKSIKVEQTKLTFSSALFHQSPIIKSEGVKTEHKTAFAIHQLNLPDNCSLSREIPVSWVLSTSKDVLIPPVFNQVATKDFTPNGILLKSAEIQGHARDVYLLLQLREHKRGTEETADHLVQFCAKPSCQKKLEILELVNKQIICDGTLSKATIKINEQCAHRSSSIYGSPDTRFYMTLSVFDHPPLNTSVPLACERSGYITVVAAGKGKDKTPQTQTAVKCKEKDVKVSACANNMEPVQEVPSIPDANYLLSTKPTKVVKVLASQLAVALDRIDSLEKQIAKLSDVVNILVSLQLPNQQATYPTTNEEYLNTNITFDEQLESGLLSMEGEASKDSFLHNIVQ
eukprot:CAMPEP_0168548842 /NCGR_PEP_ID=MMETSP0413-20121227/4785_1 /TAXON_ID=136452 /ORGANISM="Filamoeba nolandi, Strain NC-AS-23-1" /LENGTH=425 /DNA_ID=CAMNT_0008579189 /DNA_START=56 /DNA_END=1333 /DNA_ORIENTATION=-